MRFLNDFINWISNQIRNYRLLFVNYSGPWYGYILLYANLCGFLAILCLLISVLIITIMPKVILGSSVFIYNSMQLFTEYFFTIYLSGNGDVLFGDRFAVQYHSSVSIILVLFLVLLFWLYLIKGILSGSNIAMLIILILLIAFLLLTLTTGIGLLFLGELLMIWITVLCIRHPFYISDRSGSG